MIDPKDSVKIEFTIPGDPVGFVASARRGFKVSYQNKTRVAKYIAYAEKCRVYALQRGFQLPLFNSRTMPTLIDVFCFFRNGTHPDPENVRKAVVDALCYTGNDKYTGGFILPPQYDSENPRVELCVEWYSPERLQREFEVLEEHKTGDSV